MGLQHGDLKDLIYNVFEIDSYKSKMGRDKDIVVLSFSAKTEDAGRDLVNFIEKGYSFVLDADVTSGEQSTGDYKVFVEMERGQEVPENVLELLDGVRKISANEDFKFRYYKSFKSSDATLEELQNSVPLDSQAYEQVVNETNLNNYKNFFNNSYVDSIDMMENILTIKKIYADPVAFRFVDFGEKQNILDGINESLNFNDFAEVIFLSKYIGDYNITKYGNKITLENKDKVLVVERINL